MFANKLLIDFAYSLAIVFSALIIGLLFKFILFWILHRIAKRTEISWDEKTLDYLDHPARWLFPLLAIRLITPALKLNLEVLEAFHHILKLMFIGTFSYLLVHLIFLLRDVLLSRYDLQSTDNLAARKVYTQIRVMEKALYSIVTLATISFMLMTFDGIRQVGVSLLASAGIAGIIIGLAAQKSIGTLLAGIQIAIAQPIRMDDVVIVEGEWGKIEEINLTYVVVKIWDLRRLVVPITFFLEKPFQNWTRASSELLGTVFLYLDYSMPVDALRVELERLVKSSPLWDGKTCGLSVTDCKETTVEIRLLMSSASASNAWDLRCLVREKMIAFVQCDYPGCLPRFRTEFTRAEFTPFESVPTT